MRAPTGTAQLIAQTENNLRNELPLRGRGACRPRCGRQASGTPKVWHGAAVTEGVRQARIARPLLEFVQNFGFAHLLNKK